jgi:uncharacterized membrane protein YkvA (DUF1232 family)
MATIVATSRAVRRLGWTGTVRLLWRLPGMIRLHARLLRDARVAPWTKALPVAAVAYVVLPFDLVPDSLPLLGQLDDVAVLMGAARWFLRLCPRAVVGEHARTLGLRFP